jgi:hypothetical protein
MHTRTYTHANTRTRVFLLCDSACFEEISSILCTHTHSLSLSLSLSLSHARARAHTHTQEPATKEAGDLVLGYHSDFTSEGRFKAFKGRDVFFADQQALMCKLPGLPGTLHTYTRYLTHAHALSLSHTH